MLPVCNELGIAYLPYFPLASGLLTGKYQRGQEPPEGTRLQRWGKRAAGVLTDESFDKIDALTAWAQGQRAQPARPGLRLVGRQPDRGCR